MFRNQKQLQKCVFLKANKESNMLKYGFRVPYLITKNRKSYKITFLSVCSFVKISRSPKGIRSTIPWSTKTIKIKI